MDIVVTQIKQIGREIMLDGNSLVGYQHSPIFYYFLLKTSETKNPFKGMWYLVTVLVGIRYADRMLLYRKRMMGHTFCCLMGV